MINRHYLSKFESSVNSFFKFKTLKWSGSFLNFNVFNISHSNKVDNRSKGMNTRQMIGSAIRFFKSSKHVVNRILVLCCCWVFLVYKVSTGRLEAIQSEKNYGKSISLQALKISTNHRYWYHDTLLRTYEHLVKKYSISTHRTALEHFETEVLNII